MLLEPAVFPVTLCLLLSHSHLCLFKVNSEFIQLHRHMYIPAPVHFRTRIDGICERFQLVEYVGEVSKHSFCCHGWTWGLWT